MKTSTVAGKKILELRTFLGIGQKELAKRLGTSAMSLSRWERDEFQPPGKILLRLGNLATESPEGCWDFWEMAGLTFQDVSRALPRAAKSSARTLTVLQVVKAGADHELSEETLVAIPMSSLVASAGADAGSPSHELRSVTSRNAVVAPKLWCPNPAHSICMRVSGDSMEPLLQDNYIIVVDQKQNDRKKLNGSIVVVHHTKLGLVVTRFWSLKGAESLVPDNHKHSPLPWSAAWRMTGKVLWWIGQPT
jgi:phage repressor protein C with HTH and peptisase S24 domain